VSRWDDGVYALDSGPDPVIEKVIGSKADALFLELLELFAEQGQNLGVQPGTSYAPAKMAKHSKGKGYTKDQFAKAMQRLLDAKRLAVMTEGPPSRQRSRLVTVQA
jgi:hypothetical protein